MIPFLESNEERARNFTASSVEQTNDWAQKYAELQKENEELRLRYIEYKCQANYWQAQFERLNARFKQLEQQLAKITEELRKREHQLFGRKSERGSAVNEQSGKVEEQRRSRGHQPGVAGHAKRSYEELAQIIETISLPEEVLKCPCCGLPYKELWGTEDSDIVEINVNPYVRRIKRKKYQRCCNCNHNAAPQIITAPQVSKVLAKSRLGTSIWASLLLSKYEHKCPINRALEELSQHGLSLATGTIIDGFQKLQPLFLPIYDAINKKNIESEHWHADETGWKVFEQLEGKKNEQWYLWIFQNKTSVVFRIAPSRSSKVLVEHFGEAHGGGILNVDRYVAYKAISKKGMFILAFCWAHVRRDFLNCCKGEPQLEGWGLGWVGDIAKLYHTNNLRVQYREKSKTFRAHDKALKKAVARMRERLDAELKDEKLSSSAKKILTSLANHWEGLTVFVEQPYVPMDNNEAERGLRSSVVGRKNYYGSSAIWSAQLAASLFTIFGTLKLWHVNPHTWLLSYLEECANCGGNVPTDIEKFLPWNMTDEQKDFFNKTPNKFLLPSFNDSG
jgi:transposase